MTEPVGTITVGEFGGKRTAKQAVIDMIDEAEKAEMAIVILVNKEGEVSTSWSDGQLIRLLGALEFSKARIREIQTP